MSSVNERIKIVIETCYNNNVSEFERISGLKKDTLKHVVTGRLSKPSFETIESIIRTNIQIEPLWFITGEGEMLKNSGVIIGDSNTVGDIANSSSHINKNSVNVTFPESGTQKIIKPDGTVELSTESSSNEKLELLKREIKSLEKEISHLNDKMKVKDDLIVSQKETIELLKHRQ